MILELPAEHKGGPIFTLLETDEDVPTHDNNSPSPPFYPEVQAPIYLPCQGGYIDIDERITQVFETSVQNQGPRATYVACYIAMSTVNRMQ